MQNKKILFRMIVATILSQLMKDRKSVANFSNNQLILSVIFKVLMPNIFGFQLLQCQNLLICFGFLTLNGCGPGPTLHSADHETTFDVN